MEATKKLIDQQISGIKDWRGGLLAKLRTLIHQTDAEIKEEWKWEVPVFTHNGLVCAISAFKDHVKINFFKGALLNDPNKLINSGLTSKTHRSIDFSQSHKLNDAALKELIKEAVNLNLK